MYNRADELCACTTFGEFEKVYQDSNNLEKGFWLLGLRERTAHDALEAFSVESNLFPGRKAPPTTSDDVVPKTSKRCNTFCERRGKLGICEVKDLETLGNSAPIRWYISPEEMRNMKRFKFCFEMSPEELFWQEKMLRHIKECNSVDELRKIAELLTKIATTRQIAIKGLVKDALELMQETLKAPLHSEANET